MLTLPAPLQLSAARDPPDLPTDTLRLFVGGRELSSDSALVSEVGLGHGHVMHAQASHRCQGLGLGLGFRVRVSDVGLGNGHVVHAQASH